MMEANEMIERYTQEVARRLPRRTRDDIRLELQSLLAEKLERQAEKTGQPPDEAMAAALLQEMGSPRKVAAQYRGEEYLIGPALFPAFKTVVPIVLAVITGIFLVGFFIRTLWLGTTVSGELVADLLANFVGAVFQALLIVIVIFAVLERVPGVAEEAADEGEWDPRALPPVAEEKEFTPAELVLGIIFPLLAIIVFNYYPYWVIDVEPAAGETALFPILDEAFLALVPWLTATWILAIVLRLVVLFQGGWTTVTRWVEYAVDLFGLYVAYLIFQSSPLTINGGLDILVRFALGIAIIVGAVSAVITPFKLVFKRKRAPSLEEIKEMVQPGT